MWGRVGGCRLTMTTSLPAGRYRAARWVDHAGEVGGRTVVGGVGCFFLLRMGGKFDNVGNLE